MADPQSVQPQRPTVAAAKAEGRMCGQCHWLNTRYRGKTCADQGYKQDTQACDSFQEWQASIDDIRKDGLIQQINKEVADTLTPVFDKSLFDELQKYLIFSIKMGDKEDRPVPQHFNTVDEWTTLQNLIEQCQAYRDRVLDILFSFTRIKQNLDRLWRQAEAHIVERYQSAFTNYRDVGQRTAIINELLGPLSNLYDEIKTLTAKCEQTNSNLNAASFALREIKEIAVHIHNLRKDSSRQV